MFQPPKDWLAGFRERKRARIARDYGSLSTRERNDVSHLREEHGLGRSSPDQELRELRQTGLLITAPTSSRG